MDSRLQEMRQRAEFHVEAGGDVVRDRDSMKAALKRNVDESLSCPVASQSICAPRKVEQGEGACEKPESEGIKTSRANTTRPASSFSLSPGPR